MTRVDVERLARLLDGDTVKRWDVSSGISGAEEQLLNVAAALRRGSLPPPGPAFTSMLRVNLVASAGARSTSPSMVERVRWAYEDLAGRLRYSLRAAGVTAAMAACLAIAGIGLGAERSFPLDPLYGMKLSLEQARLAVISDGLERAAREMSYSKDRVVEAWGAMERGDPSRWRSTRRTGSSGPARPRGSPRTRPRSRRSCPRNGPSSSTSSR